MKGLGMALARVEHLLHAASGRRIVLGVTGAPGAGKSTFAEQLVSACGVAAVLVPMDGFHLANPVLDECGLRDCKGAPETFDARGFLSVLERIRLGDHDVYAPLFDRDADQAVAAAIRVPREAPLVVTEGNYLLLPQDPWNRVRQQLDEAWYLRIDDDLRRCRLAERHERFGKSRSEAEDWVAAVDEPNARIVQAVSTVADMVVDL